MNNQIYKFILIGKNINYKKKDKSKMSLQINGEIKNNKNLKINSFIISEKNNNIKRIILQ